MGRKKGMININRGKSRARDPPVYPERFFPV